MMEQVITGDAEPSARDLDKGRLQISAAQTIVEAATEPSPPRPVPRAPSPPPVEAEKADGNDSDAISDWSRSPTPPPRSTPAKIPPPKPAAAPRPAQPAAGPSRARDKPVDFEDEAREANEDIARLQQQSRKAQQMATDVTQQMSHEVQVRSLSRGPS